MKSIIICLALNVCVVISGIAQEFEYRSVKEIQESALQSFADGDYDQAYTEFIKINKSDTAYFSAQVDAILCAFVQKRFDTAVVMCNNVLEVKKLSNPFEPTIINLLGQAYIGKEEYDSALQVIDKGIEAFPFHSNLHKTRGDALYKQDKVEESIDAYQTTIRYNPRNSQAHLKLGIICAERGEITRAMMCLNMATFLKAPSEKSVSVLVYMEEVAKGEVKEEKSKVSFPEEEDFSEIDLILKNKVAFNKKYKVKSKLTYPFVAQNQIMLENLRYNPKDPGFWNQNYVRFLTGLSKDGHVEAYGYYLCSGVESDEISKLILKSKSKIKNLLDWTSSNFTNIMNERTVRDGGKHVKNKFNHVGDFGFDSISELDPKTGKVIGKFTTFHSNGLPHISGEFNSKGERMGTWEYWDKSGHPTSKEEYTDGELSKVINYYKNGSKELVLPVTNGAVHGTKVSYYPFDSKYYEIEAKNGEETGLAKFYYRTGELSSEIEITDGKRNGFSKSYYASGQLMDELNYKDNVPEGVFKSYHENGKINTEGKYENGKRNGTWTWHYDNGQLMTTGEFDDDNRLGEWIEYDDEGKKTSVSQYGEGGKKMGVYQTYDHNGKLEMELTYKGEEVISYKFFNPEGEVISEGEKKKRELELEGRHRNGNISMKGKFYKSEKSGLWEYYDFNGSLETRENFDEDGKLHGESKNFFRDGTLEASWVYDHGKRDGAYLDYYKNGNLFRQGWYVDGEPTGEWATFYKDGTIKTSYYYINGDLNGFYDEFDEKGRLRTKSLYFNGYAQWINYYDTLGTVESSIDLSDGSGSIKIKLQGAVTSEHTYKGSEINGTSKWYNLGELETEGAFVDGERSGEWIWYHRNKKVDSKGSYKVGKREGTWEWYHENGQLACTGDYKDGEKQGTMTWYNEDGSLDQVKNYLDGEVHGRCDYYDPKGKYRYSKEYDHGALVAYTYKGKDGKEKPWIALDINGDKIDSYFDNGKPAYFVEYKNGYIDGAYKKYYYNGQIHVDGTYKKDDLDGPYTSYHANGKVKFKGTYKDDLLTGECLEYYDNGQLKSKMNYILGSPDGWVKVYEKNGNLKEEVYYLLGEIIKKK